MEVVAIIAVLVVVAVVLVSRSGSSPKKDPPQAIHGLVKGSLILSSILGLLFGGLVWADDARADTAENCVEQFWMVGLRSATRTICDGPIAADGTWMRARTFTAPAFVADGYSVCYSPAFCTFTMPREVAAYDVADTYLVTADTVLPDEPGHITEQPAT